MKSASQHIRVLGAADTEVYRHLRLEGLRIAPYAFGGDAEREARLPRDDFRHRLETTSVLGGFTGGDLLGIMSYLQGDGPKIGHRAFMSSVYVSPVAQGTGLAQKMMGYVLDLAKARGVQQIELCVSECADRARAFYEKYGFEQVGTLPRAIWYEERFVSELQMILRLDA